MEQTEGFRNRPTINMANCFGQRRRIFQWRRTVSFSNGVETIGRPNETGKKPQSKFHTLYKNLLKMTHRYKCKTIKAFLRQRRRKYL